MGKTTVTIEADDSLPPEVLREHVQWAMDDLTKETGGATVTLDTPNARSHPFEGGVEMFDDYNGPYASGGYIPAGTHLEGAFSDPGYVIPREAADKLGAGIIERAVRAIREGRQARGEM